MDELIKQYYNKPEYSDVTVKWSGREIKAHRMVLCGRSEYFKKAIGPGSQFKVWQAVSRKKRARY